MSEETDTEAAPTTATSDRPSTTSDVETGDASESGVIPEECIPFGHGEVAITQTVRYDALFQSALDVQAALEERSAALQSALDAAAAAWNQPPLPSPPTSEDIEQLLASVQAQTPADVLARVGTDRGRASCTLDLDAAFGVGSSCLEEAGCPAPASADAVTCVGVCEGICSGSCSGEVVEVPSASECRGFCEGTCGFDPEHQLACTGICEGVCNTDPPQENYSGYCPAPCDGTCVMSMGGECQGTCNGDCRYGSSPNQCRDVCEGECEGNCMGLLAYGCEAWDCGALASAVGAVDASCADIEVRFAYPTRGDDPDLDARFDAFALAAGEVLRLHFELRMLLGSEEPDAPTELAVRELQRQLELVVVLGQSAADIVPPERRHCVIEAAEAALAVLVETEATVRPLIEGATAFREVIDAGVGS